MFNLLGIDWGTKWVGLALADTKTKLVVPFESVKLSEAESFIKIVLAKYNISHIIIGRPVNFQLQPTEVTLKVEEFATEMQNKLQANFPKIEVILFNERNSSKESLLGFKPSPSSKKSSFGFKTKKVASPSKNISANSIHSLAAKTILEYYLEKSIL